MRGIHRWPVNSPHKGPVTRKMFPFDDVIMTNLSDLHVMVVYQNDSACKCQQVTCALIGHQYVVSLYIMHWLCAVCTAGTLKWGFLSKPVVRSIEGIVRYLHEGTNPPILKYHVGCRPLLALNPISFMTVPRYATCMIWSKCHDGHSRVSMVVADNLASIWRQGICNHHDDGDIRSDLV